MTVASGLYVVSFTGAMNASVLAVNVANSANKVILVNDTHTPNFDTHNDYADITNEVSGTGYTANNKTVGGTPTYALGQRRARRSTRGRPRCRGRPRASRAPRR